MKGRNMPELDVVELTKELVAIDSVSRRSNATIADFVERVMRESGFTVERIEHQDLAGEAKFNVVGVIGPGIGGLGFFSHVDTVPGVGWDRDPWTPVVEGDHLIGLGSCDMKGALAATIVAAACVPAESLNRPVLISATADEEITLQGAIEVVNRSRLFRDAQLRYGVVCEPTGLTPVYAHKGGILARATAHGVAAHTSTDKGISANFLIAPFLAEMAELATMLKDDVSYQRPEFAPPTLGFNMTVNDGGTMQNVTAAKTVCTISFRPTPNDRSSELLAHITERAEHYGLEFTAEVFQPFSIDPGSPIVRTALAATGATRPETVPFGTEATYYQSAAELVILGPGSITQAHTNGEWISVTQLREAAGVYSRMIETLCG
jgi:acetylornithine deacetylase